jgi:hypothetical protein
VYAVSVKKEKKTSSPPSGQNKQKIVRSTYTPISDALSQPNTLADNEFAEGVKRFDLVGNLGKNMKRERRNGSVELASIVMTLLVWPVLKASSIHCFCSELCQYLKRCLGRPEDVIYDFWGREDINWRNWARQVSAQVIDQVDLGSVPKRAFVVDDSLKPRRGKKVEGTSRHYDHNRGITTQGHQLLELGLAGENGFAPLDRQLFMGESSPIEKAPGKDFKDKRSAAAVDMKRAREEDKHQMLARMLKGAIKAGYQATYLLGDAWFGTKQNIALAVENGLKAIFQMKRGKLKYRFNGKLYNATELYARFHRKMKAGSGKSRYKTVRIEAEINLQTKANAEPVWQRIVLILSAPKDDSQANWVIFLSTDTEASTEKILEIYALRWSIEVYFKEVKQNFGLLADQSGKYQVAYASVHLAAVRYLLIFEAMLRNGKLSFGEVRDLQSGKLLALSYASLLWTLFRAIIAGALEQFEEMIGKDMLNRIAKALDCAVESFLNDALQISPTHVSLLQKAEATGNL